MDPSRKDNDATNTVAAMLAPLDTLHRLTASLREALAAGAGACGTRVLSIALELPQAPAMAPRVAGPQFHLVHGHRDELRAGYGIAGEWRAAGPQRLAVLRGQAHRLARSWTHLDPDETGYSGFAFLGFGAQPLREGSQSAERLPNALLWLPEIALHRRHGRAALILTARLPAPANAVLDRWTRLLERLVPGLAQPAPGPLRPAPLRRTLDTPTPAGWQHLVQAALERIAARGLDKVVLARRLRVEGSRPFDLGRLMTALTFLFPSCQVLDIRRGDTSLVAATPERLLTLRGNRVEVDALAGTTTRATEAGRDGALARALRQSPKDLHEHRLVIRGICEALGQCGARLQVPPRPEVMQLTNAQHLWTQISATLETKGDIFELAERLHPTPATNGEPRAQASAWLREHATCERGWYTGAAGILEPDLNGELWVLLRCAEIRGRIADLYAGAGIVEGSHPALEWQETEHKLAAMLTALQFA